MLTAADTFHRAQPRLLGLVKRSEAQTGSRMLAYDAVARRIGATPSWVRKFLGNQPVAEPSYSLVSNILAAYREACQHWDDVAAEERRRFFELGGAPHEVAESTGTSLGLDEGADQTGAGRTPPVVAEVVDPDGERLTAGLSSGRGQ